MTDMRITGGQVLVGGDGLMPAEVVLRDGLIDRIG